MASLKAPISAENYTEDEAKDVEAGTIGRRLCKL